MTIRIYNSLTRKKEEFKPIRKNQVGMYVCGPTVYDQPHIGHARAAYIFEVVRNYFEYRGYKVNFVRNITDVDDKIIAKAKEELMDLEIEEVVKKIAQKYTQKYYEDMKSLGIRQATIAPKATEHIKQMQDYVAGLIGKGFAYEVDGDVYFDVQKFKDYGRLSHQDLEQMRSAVRIEKDEKKRNPLDFALWKKAKKDEPSWESPWGRGRPGWHIECSVMSSEYLGDEFDIHSGGQDLIFPHHENEIAQSQSYSGKSFARIWMHNGLLTINGQKMAKSLGNFISIGDFLKDNSPEVLKIFFLSCHYRSPIDFNQRKIHEAKKAYERLQILFNKLDEKLPESEARNGPNKDVLKFKKRFEDAMDDDFNTPQALAALFDLSSFCNKLLINYKEKHRQNLQGAQELFNDCSRIFAVYFGHIQKEKIPATKIEELIREREQCRQKGNFSQADKIRKELEEKGVILEDTKEGTKWRIKIQ